MASPPSKRQKHHLVTKHDDRKELAKEYKHQGYLIGTPAKPQARPVTQKSRPIRKKSVQKELVLGHSFFNSKTQSQIQAKSQSHKVREKSDQDDNLDIEDDFDSDAPVQADYAPTKIAARRNSRLPSSRNKHLDIQIKTSNSGSHQTSVVKSDPLRNGRAHTHAASWIDLHPPTSLEELCVHRRKVEEIDDWLQSAIKGHQYRRLLILKGPAGCGKTAAVKLLAEKRRINVTEWLNPTQFSTEQGDNASLSARFSDFLNRKAHLTSLILSDHRSGSLDTVKHFDTEHAAVVIDDFPTSVHSSSTALSSVRRSLLLHLQTRSSTPVVLIFSEGENSASGSAEILGYRKLLGPTILEHPAIATIELNRVAPTFMRRALELVLDKQTTVSGHKYTVDSGTLRALGGIGDIRNAINNLQLICTGDEALAANIADSTRRHRYEFDTRSLPDTEQMRTQGSFNRDIYHDLFHSIGKIVYNKREGENLFQPPSHLLRSCRPRKSSVDVNELVDHLQASNNIYLLALHENYVLSCESPDFVEVVARASDNLSDGDMLGIHSTNHSNSVKVQSSDAIALARQEDIALQTAIRGLLFSLPYPVTRAASRSGKNKHQLAYPAFARLRYQQNEIRDQMEEWLLSASSFRAKRCSGNFPDFGEGAVLRTKFSGESQSPSPGCPQPHVLGSDPQPMTQLSGDSLVLHDIPYASMIWRSRKGLDKMEPLVGALHFSSLLHEAVAQRPAAATRSVLSGKISDSHIAEHKAAHDQASVTKLYLSDDDIED